METLVLVKRWEKLWLLLSHRSRTVPRSFSEQQLQALRPLLTAGQEHLPAGDLAQKAP